MNGKKLKEILDSQNMSITDFAAKIGKTKQSVSLYVKNGIPGSELIEQIADVLGVNPCELLESIIR